MQAATGAAADPPVMKNAGKLTPVDPDPTWFYTQCLMVIGFVLLGALVARGRWGTGLAIYAVIGAVREFLFEWDAWTFEGVDWFSREDAIHATLQGASQRSLEWMQVGIVAFGIGAAVGWTARRFKPPA